MIKLLKQGQAITFEKLNEIITAINNNEALYTRILAAISAVETKKTELAAIVEAFVTQYGTIINDTPDILDMLEQFLTLAEEQVSFTDGPSHFEE